MTEVDAGESVRFLKRLFGEDGPGYIGIWVKEPGKNPKVKDSYWFPADNPEAAFQTIDQQAVTNEVYFHLALHRNPTPTSQRGTIAGSIASPGVWLDLDWQDPGAHKKDNLPPDMDACLALIDAFPLAPTVVVFTGHGLHVYWLWRELWVFADDEDRGRAGLLGQRLTNWFRDESRKHGWGVDSAHDLGHIFRLPGTINHKYSPKAIVSIYRETETRYNPSEFDELLPVLERIDAGVVPNIGPFTINQSAGPDPDRFFAAMENIDKFRGSWERTRTDINDRSNSGWDMSLAALVVQAGWTDQEIVDLWVASRRKHGQDTALSRSYIEHTLKNVRTGTNQQQAIAQLASGAPMDRDKALLLLSQALAAPVSGAIRRGLEQATYYLVVDGTEASMGTAKTMQSQSAVRGSLFDKTGKMFPPVKTPQWFKVCEAIAEIAIFEEQPDGEPVATIGAYVADYIRGKTAGVDERPWQEALPNAEPFWKDGRWWLSVQSLRTHLSTAYAVRIEEKMLRDLLGRAGSRPHTFAASGTSRSYWPAPANGTPYMGNQNGHGGESIA